MKLTIHDMGWSKFKTQFQFCDHGIELNELLASLSKIRIPLNKIRQFFFGYHNGLAKILLEASRQTLHILVMSMPKNIRATVYVEHWIFFLGMRAHGFEKLIMLKFLNRPKCLTRLYE